MKHYQSPEPYVVEQCPACHGYGLAERDSIAPCPKCGGSGQIVRPLGEYTDGNFWLGLTVLLMAGAGLGIAVYIAATGWL